MGEDLRKFDQKKLEEKALFIYNEYRKNFTKDKLENMIGMQYSNNIRDVVSEYETEKKVNELYVDLIRKSKIKKEWQDFGHRMVFYGDGRILSLIQSNEEDDRLRGQSALFYLYDGDEGYKRSYNVQLYLYIPKGGTIDDLQVLR